MWDTVAMVCHTAQEANRHLLNLGLEVAKKVSAE
jgi:hypothetical protein